MKPHQYLALGLILLSGCATQQNSIAKAEKTFLEGCMKESGESPALAAKQCSCVWDQLLKLTLAEAQTIEKSRNDLAALKNNPLLINISGVCGVKL